MAPDLLPTLVLYNEPRRDSDGQCLESERGVLDEVEAVVSALGHLGVPHRTLSSRYLSDVVWAVASASEPVVFNLVESFWDGPADAAHVPTVLRALGKRFTGNDSAAQILGLDKWKTKSLLRCSGIPTPEAVRVAVGDEVPEEALPRPPFIIKPADTDASEGIHPSSIVEAPGPLVREQVARIHEQFAQPALIEEYVDGRELNVSLFDLMGELEVLPIAEIDFGAFGKDRPRIVDYAAKWEKGSFAYENTPRILPARLPAPLAEEVRELCRRTWRTMGLCGYARIDLRLDERNRPYILEANPNPDISPDAGFAAALRAAGIEYHEFVRLAVLGASGGSQPTTGAQAPGSIHPDKASKTTHRITQQQDRSHVLDILTRTGFFRPDELEIATEVLDDALTEGPQGHYRSVCSVSENGEVLGWICYGPTPCCIGTYDVYWAAVDPRAQGQGIGKRMFAHAEQDIAHRGGRLAIIETSSRELYTPTNRFYLACGYEPKGRIPDFYVIGDDKIIYSKSLVPPLR